MTRITTGNHLVIDSDPQCWRLLADTDTPLIEALPEALTYSAAFGAQYRLPEAGSIALTQVQRVVVGWSDKERTWQLGVLFEPLLAQQRGSRWLGLAFWDESDADARHNAVFAGESLAQVIARPFNLVPPRDEVQTLPPVAPPVTYTEAPAPAAYVPAAPAPLKPLPITLAEWDLIQAEPNVIALTLRGHWQRGMILQALWYVLWIGVFVALSVATLAGKIALPKPEFLPYLGLASAGVLLILVLRLVYKSLTLTNRIVIDGNTRTLAFMHNNREKERVSVEEIARVYVSHIVERKPKHNKRKIYFGELNLHLTNDQFGHLLKSDDVFETEGAFDETPLEEQVMPLTPALIISDMQAAAAHIAQVLGVPAVYDQRLK